MVVFWCDLHLVLNNHNIFRYIHLLYCMMRRSIVTNFARKLITLPQLSPSHTSSRLIKRLVPSNVHVGEYTPLLIVSCSPDMIEDVAFRVSRDHRQLMLLEIIEDGRIEWLNPKNNDHHDVRVVDDDGDNDVNSMVDLPVGTVIGEVCDDDDDDDDHNDDDVTEEWAWQAYMHDEDDDDGIGKKKVVELPPSLAWAAKRGLGSGSTSI